MDVAKCHHIAEHPQAVQRRTRWLLAERCVPVPCGQPAEHGRNRRRVRRSAVHDQGAGGAHPARSTRRLQTRLEAGDRVHGRQRHMLVPVHDARSGGAAGEASPAAVALAALSARQFAARLRQCGAGAAGVDGDRARRQADALPDPAPRRMLVLGGPAVQSDKRGRPPDAQHPVAHAGRRGGGGRHEGVPEFARFCGRLPAIQSRLVCECEGASNNG